MKAKFVLALVGICFVLGLFGLWYAEQIRTYKISIAAGPVEGQAFQFAKALQEISANEFPEIEIEVFETRGSLQSGRLIESGEVQLALVQADQVVGGRSNLIAALYSDVFQLVVRKDRGINQIADLRGKRIALPSARSGANKTFWFLASHYGLGKEDIKEFPGTETSTEWLFVKGEVDALFRIRAPGDRSILRLIDQSNAKLIPIEQASALELKQPSFERGLIPAGSYRGQPAIPENDTVTVSVKRLLLARSDVPESVISKLTSVLFERRRELVAKITLAGWIESPDRIMGTFLPVHPGAQAFYDRDQPSFLQENAEPIALLISILLVTSSILIQLNTRRRKRTMDQFNKELIELAKQSRLATSFEELDEYQNHLATYVDRIVLSAENGQISNHDMTLFRFTFDSVEDAIRDREFQLGRIDGSNSSLENKKRRRYRD